MPTSAWRSGEEGCRRDLSARCMGLLCGANLAAACRAPSACSRSPSAASSTPSRYSTLSELGYNANACKVNLVAQPEMPEFFRTSRRSSSYMEESPHCDVDWRGYGILGCRGLFWQGFWSALQYQSSPLTRRKSAGGHKLPGQVVALSLCAM